MSYDPRHDVGHATSKAVDQSPGKLPIPGKTTLVESAAGANVEAMDAVDLASAVSARIGETFSDGGGYSFEVIAPGAFKILTAPPGQFRGTVDPKKRVAWESIAKLMVLKVPAKRAAPTPEKLATPTPIIQTSTPTPNVPPSAPAPQAASTGWAERAQHKLHDAMEYVSHLFGGGETPAVAATPATLPTGPVVLDVAPVAKKQEVAPVTSTASATATPPKKSPVVPPPLPVGDAKGGNTLELARSRAALGDAGTTYKLDPDKAETQGMIGGAADQTVFYCSGLSIWTLAAAGIDMKTPIVGSDAVPYQFKTGATRTDKKGNVTDVVTTITIKMIIDGEPQAVEALATARKAGQEKGGLIEGTFKTSKEGGLGHEAGWDGETSDLSVRGAAGAFVLTGIGTEVPELQQKPGDFVQMRRTGNAAGDDGKHHGLGHAWQVNEVTALGSARFGLPRSPVAVDGKPLDGWHDNVLFRIVDTTDPLLVGAHSVTSAARLEANIPKSMNENAAPIAAHARERKQEDADRAAATAQANKDMKAMSKDDKKAAQAEQKAAATKAAAERKQKEEDFEATLGDGGVQITALRAVPAGKPVFVGRLGASPWSGWTPATRASASAASSAAAQTAPASVTTPTPTPTPTAAATPAPAPPAPTATTAPLTPPPLVEAPSADVAPQPAHHSGGRITVEE